MDTGVRPDLLQWAQHHSVAFSDLLMPHEVMAQLQLSLTGEKNRNCWYLSEEAREEGVQIVP